MDLRTDKMLADKENGIGWMTFNNPARRNAISMEMREAAVAILDDFERDDSVRAVVMRGAGDKAFISGADISQVEKSRSAEERRRQTAARLGVSYPLDGIKRLVDLVGRS